MHYEFLPGDQPDYNVELRIPPVQITIELFELCEEFFRHASPIVQTELSLFLIENGYRSGGLGWFLDALGFTTLLNRTASDAMSE